MATRTPDRIGTPRPGGDRRPRQNFETWSWFFMRVSGLVLIFLALTHFAITHITKIDFVGKRWSNPLWQVFDWALLALALLHGLNGLRTIIDDYVRAPARRVTVKAALYTLSFGLFAFGTLTIFTFSH
jgi:succinate dehydrogenase / fumarate reductase membrane anchor subunit